MMFARTPVILLQIAVLGLVGGCRDSGQEVTGPLIAQADRGAQEHRVVRRIRGIWENAEGPPSQNPPAGCTLHIATTQEGNASHFGRFTGHGVTCANPVGPPTETPPFWHSAPAPPYLVAEFTNEMVWTMTDGSEVWLEPNEGVFVQSLANGAASVRGLLRITGGTGRFAQAHGWLRARGGREPGEAGDRVRFRGRIEMPAAGQSEPR